MAKVVVIEDDELKKYKLTEKLKELGHEVVVAGPQPTDVVRMLTDYSEGIVLFPPAVRRYRKGDK